MEWLQTLSLDLAGCAQLYDVAGLEARRQEKERETTYVMQTYCLQCMIYYNVVSLSLSLFSLSPPLQYVCVCNAS